jgi:ATP-dependent Lhr-like helicase
LWEQSVLPGRVAGYQPRWLDELVLAGEWTWVCQTEEERGPGQVAFLRRDELTQLARPPLAVIDDDFDPEAQAIYEHLRQRGASFVVDMAQALNIPPTRVRKGLWRLLRRGLINNDHFEVVRRGEEDGATNGELLAHRPSLKSLRRQRSLRPEGRWSLVSWGAPEMETRAIQQAYLLLERYGIVARELALLDPWMLPWRVLYEVLSRLEWAGEVRRGYFVEGLSGAQFALPEAARPLAEHSMMTRAAEPVILLHALDPANLYASGGLLREETAISPTAAEGSGAGLPTDGANPSLARRPGNWLAVRAGRPVLLIGNHGKRLLTCPDASREDLLQAVQSLRELLQTGQGADLRAKVSVESWNGQPVTSTDGREFLEAAGFLRDYQAMTLYAAWK